jgi:hypothetical protein
LLVIAFVGVVIFPRSTGNLPLTGVASPIPTNTLSIEKECVIAQKGYTFQVITSNFDKVRNECELEYLIPYGSSDISYGTKNSALDVICSFSSNGKKISVRESRNSTNSPVNSICSWLSELPSSEIVTDQRILNKIISVERNGNYSSDETTSSNSMSNLPPGNCTPWSDVTLADVGKTMCVFGVVRHTWYSEQNLTQYFTFSSDPEAIFFQKFMYTFDPGIDGRCIFFKGKIYQSYNTPYMDLLPDDAIYFCD